MTKEPIISFQNVNKQFNYVTAQTSTIFDVVFSAFHRNKAEQDERFFLALQDVSFDIYPGQCIGIIGRNGCGKSTALKIAARILRPTSGRVIIRGRVSALLELGAGFHQDLTGRENIYLNASLLGLDKEEIDQKYNDIVEFSELNEFIDMPVKHYSSGMYMRLGFSVAIHMDPEILIIDEILAVGDQAFQTKCIERIYDLKFKGTTILVVSHSMDMLRQLCSHLIWLDHGEIKEMGTTEEVSESYGIHTQGIEHQQADEQVEEVGFERWGNEEAEITAVRFLNADEEETEIFMTNDTMIIEMAYMFYKPVLNPEFGLAIHREDGIMLNGPNTNLAQVEMGDVEGKGVIRYKIERLPLLPAKYDVTVAIHDSKLGFAYDYHKMAYPFQIKDGGTVEKHGLIEFPAVWDWQPDTGSVLSQGDPI